MREISRLGRRPRWEWKRGTESAISTTASFWGETRPRRTPLTAAVLCFRACSTSFMYAFCDNSYFNSPIIFVFFLWVITGLLKIYRNRRSSTQVSDSHDVSVDSLELSLPNYALLPPCLVIVKCEYSLRRRFNFISSTLASCLKNIKLPAIKFFYLKERSWARVICF